MAHQARSALSAAGRWLRSVRPERRHLRADILAGLPGAISSVPDGMAAAVLAGVNPVQGLYACFAGPIAGGLSSNTRLMVITTTSAAALAAGSALQSVPPAQRPAAVPLLVIMVGIALVAAGFIRLGRYTRFVSYSVMIGFLTGIAVNIVCGQIGDLTGAPAHGAFPLAKAVSVLVHPGRIDLPSLLTGLAALAILVVLARTPLAVVQCADCTADPHRGGDTGRRGQRRQSRGRGRHPARHPAPAASRLQAPVVQPGHRRAGDRRHRPGAGRGGRRSRAEPGRCPAEPEPGHHRARGRQPGRWLLPRHRGRRLGRADRAKRDRRWPDPVGGDLVRRLDAGDPRHLLRAGRRRSQFRPSGPYSSSRPSARCGQERSPASCAPGGSRRSRSSPPSPPRCSCRSPRRSASGWPCRCCCS